MQWVLFPLLTLLLLWGGHYAMQAMNRAFPFDCPRYWPFSVFNPRRPSVLEWAIAAISAVGGVCGIRWVERQQFKAGPVVVVGLFIVIGTTAIQGVPRGFAYPVDGGLRSKEQYYHDAERVQSPSDFLRQFNTVQPSLRIHSRTHPPRRGFAFLGFEKSNR